MVSSPGQYKREFLASVEATEIRGQLIEMEKNPIYITEVSYSPKSELGVTFSEKHLDYISVHPNLRPSDYMANLRLMTRLR